MKLMFEKFLLDKDDFERLYSQNVKNAATRYIASLLLGIVSTFWISFFLTDMDTSSSGVVAAMTLMSALALVTLGLLIFSVKTYFSKSLLKKMQSEAQNNSEWNVIFIVSSTWRTRNHGGLKQFLVEFNKAWQCDFLPHLPLDKNKTYEEQIGASELYIASLLNVPITSVQLNFICERTNVKFHIHDGKEKVIKYSFVNVIIVDQSSYTLKQMRKHFESKKSRRYWRTIEKLHEDINTVTNNFDVLKYIDELRGQIRDFSSEERFEVSNLKIIWNITKKCGYTCNICATHDDKREELSLEAKKAVLLSILVKRANINEIDFSGGDPLCCAENKAIIDIAQDFLGEDKVTITTTAKGIANLSAEEKEKYLINCELTFDIPPMAEGKENLRGSLEYYETNKEFIELDRDKIQDLQVNVPILDTGIVEPEIRDFIERIKKMAPSRITLIRLMPVGKTKFEKYPKNYNPAKIIQLFQDSFDDIYLNCALRVKYNTNEVCTMLREKIGIDCAGNVFACGWAGYICEDVDIGNNPFYLGNLIHQSFDEILNTDKARRISKGCDNTRGDCPIFSYLASGDMFNNSDPLVIKHQN